MTRFNSDILRPGMTMGYRPSSPFGKVIRVKTWVNLSHVETYVGGGFSVGARWEGVNRYPVRIDDALCIVWEPVAPFDVEKAMVWFYSEAQGMKYDLWGMRIFYRLIRKSNPNRMWCSEFCTEFYRAGGFEPFQPETPADRISPAQFLQTAGLRVVWSNGEAYRVVKPKF